MNAMTQVTVIDMAIPTIQSFVKIYSLTRNGGKTY